MKFFVLFTSLLTTTSVLVVLLLLTQLMFLIILIIIPHLFYCINVIMCFYNTAIYCLELRNNCLELRKMIMATILIPPSTKCNQFANNIPYTRLSIIKQFLKSTIKDTCFLLFINSIYMCLLYCYHLKGVKRVGCVAYAMPLLTLSLQ